MEATQPAPSSQRSRTRSPLRARTHALRGKRSLCPRLPLRCPRPKRSLSPNIVFRAGLPSTSFAASLPQPAKEALGFVETCAGLSAAWPSLPAVAALSWCLPCRSLHGVLARLLAHARASHSLLACAHLHLRIYVRAYLRTHSLTHARQASAYSLCVLTQGDRGARCTSTLAPRCRMQNEECDVLEMLGADRTTALLGVLAQTMRASTATAARGPSCGGRRNGGRRNGGRRNGGPAHGGAPRA